MDKSLEAKLLLKYLKSQELTNSFNTLAKEANVYMYSPIVDDSISKIESHNFAEIRQIIFHSKLSENIKESLTNWIDLFEYVYIFIDDRFKTTPSSYKVAILRLQNAILNTPLLTKLYKQEFQLLPLYILADRLTIICKGLGIRFNRDKENELKVVVEDFFKDKILNHYKEYSYLNKLDFKFIARYENETSKIKNVFPSFEYNCQTILNTGLQFNLIETIDDFLDDIDFITISSTYKELFIVSKRQGLQRLNIKKCIEENITTLETILSETYTPNLEFNIKGDIVVDVENSIDNSRKRYTGITLKYSFENLDSYKRIVGRVHVSTNGNFLAVDTSDKKVILLIRNSENNYCVFIEISEVLSYCFVDDVFLCCGYNGHFGAFDLNAKDKRNSKLSVNGTSLVLGDKIPITLKYIKERNKLYMLKLNGIIDIWDIKREDDTIIIGGKISKNTKMPNNVMGDFLTVNDKILLFLRYNVSENENSKEIKTTHLSLFDVDNECRIVEYEGIQKAIKYFLYPSIDRVNFRYTISGDVYGNILLWNAKTGKNIGKIKAHSCISNSTEITIINGAYYIFSSSDDRTLKIWRLIEDSFNNLPLVDKNHY